MLGKLLLVLNVFAVSAFALPHYYVNVPGGLATMILNQSQTGAAVDIFGTLPAGSTPRNFVVIGGGLVPYDSGTFSAPDFGYNGTVYFSGFCCGSFTIDTGGQYSATWIFDYAASGAGGVSGIDYSNVGRPPTDLVPEPSTLGVVVTGVCALVAYRRRRQA